MCAWAVFFFLLRPFARWLRLQIAERVTRCCVCVGNWLVDWLVCPCIYTRYLVYVCIPFHQLILSANTISLSSNYVSDVMNGSCQTLFWLFPTERTNAHNFFYTGKKIKLDFFSLGLPPHFYSNIGKITFPLQFQFCIQIILSTIHWERKTYGKLQFIPSKCKFEKMKQFEKRRCSSSFGVSFWHLRLCSHGIYTRTPSWTTYSRR